MSHLWLHRHNLTKWTDFECYMWTLMLKYHTHLSQSYTNVYMMTSSVLYVEPLHVHS